MLARSLHVLPLLTVAVSMLAAESAPADLNWSSLPPLPDALGFGGMYAGVSGGALVAAGGANFPDRPMAEGGKKAWSDRVYVLPAPGGTWREVGRLPQPAAYGVSGTWRDAVVCAGGDNAGGSLTAAWLLRWDGHRLATEPLPPLPHPVSYAAGVVADDTFYLFGGHEKPGAALASALALDLAAPQRAWRELPWPKGAAARTIAVAGAAGGDVYLLSGLAAGVAPAPGHYLRDAYAYAPGRGWRRIADLPEPVAAAPGPAFTAADGRLMVLSGVSALWGTAGGPGPATGGFAKIVYAYVRSADRWERMSAVRLTPEPVPARVTAPLVSWAGGFAAVGGEIAPGIRTPSVLFLRSGPGAVVESTP